MSEKSAADRLAEIEKRRADRKAALAEQYTVQRAIDLEALDAAEEKHGDSYVCHLDVPYAPGLPTLVVGRCPTPSELKRYRDRVKPKANGKTSPDAAFDAAKELTAVVLEYPSAEVFAELCAVRASLDVQLGVEALGLAQASQSDEGKG